MKKLNLYKSIQTAAFLGGSILTLTLGSETALACSDDAYLGSVCVTSGNFCPKDFVPADGKVLAISSNQALYSLLGNMYGGSAPATFALPDLRSRTPVGIGGSLDIQQGQLYGQETVTLTVSQLAEHNHGATFTPDTSGGFSVKASKNAALKEIPSNGDMLATPPVNGYISNGQQGSPVMLGGATVPPSTGSVVQIANAGSAPPTPISVIDPQTSAQYCIKMKGIYPPRPY
ncbi:microcystin dependent protein [Terasakiella brassicae]|uniref:Microcystin dependent protein n=1 Tax=Terasakiella brassicae TaxID=1634917 RepID=A0A917F667_9PROT|nr:tail fiber protein [Terasakiella brassicae]GGF55111.1 microcystin dependent protein [Terasakiella brassicae]